MESQLYLRGIIATPSFISNLAIVPMQDYLELSNEEGRMNTPSTASGNWAWRISPRYNTAKLRAKMLALVEKTGRAK